MGKPQPFTRKRFQEEVLPIEGQPSAIPAPDDLSDIASAAPSFAAQPRSLIETLLPQHMDMGSLTSEIENIRGYLKQGAGTLALREQLAGKLGEMGQEYLGRQFAAVPQLADEFSKLSLGRVSPDDVAWAEKALLTPQAGERLVTPTYYQPPAATPSLLEKAVPSLLETAPPALEAAPSVLGRLALLGRLATPLGVFLALMWPKKMGDGTISPEMRRRMEEEWRRQRQQQQAPPAPAAPQPTASAYDPSDRTTEELVADSLDGQRPGESPADALNRRNAAREELRKRGGHPDAAASKRGDPAATFRYNQYRAQEARDKGDEGAARGYDAENKIITEKGTDVVEAGKEITNAGRRETEIDVETKSEVIEVKSGRTLPSPAQLAALRRYAASVNKPLRIIYGGNVPDNAVRDFRRRNPDVIIERRPGL